MTNTEQQSVDTLLIGETEFRWGERTFIMGVVNATPDSFSGDGVLPNPGDIRQALDQALRMQYEGADIIDIGGESTRPKNIYADAQPVGAEEEIERVVPIIEALTGNLTVPISIDTRKAKVARAAISAGANLVNDVSMLEDPDMPVFVTEKSIPIIVSHIRQRGHSDNVVDDVITDLELAVATLTDHGLQRSSVLLDPGIGFAKTAGQSIDLVRNIEHIRHRLKSPILIGTSRKSFIGSITEEPVADRKFGTAATVALAIKGGVDVVRVHDVKHMVAVAKMSDAVARCGENRSWTDG